MINKAWAVWKGGIKGRRRHRFHRLEACAAAQEAPEVGALAHRRDGGIGDIFQDRGKRTSCADLHTRRIVDIVALHS